MEEVPQHKEYRFDGKGNPRRQITWPDGTTSFLSDEEYKEELENRKEK